MNRINRMYIKTHICSNWHYSITALQCSHQYPQCMLSTLRLSVCIMLHEIRVYIHLKYAKPQKNFVKSQYWCNIHIQICSIMMYFCSFCIVICNRNRICRYVDHILYTSWENRSSHFDTSTLEALQNS
jgi:hypothetical protein